MKIRALCGVFVILVAFALIGPPVSALGADQSGADDGCSAIVSPAVVSPQPEPIDLWVTPPQPTGALTSVEVEAESGIGVLDFWLEDDGRIMVRLDTSDASTGTYSLSLSGEVETCCANLGVR